MLVVLGVALAVPFVLGLVKERVVARVVAEAARHGFTVRLEAEGISIDWRNPGVALNGVDLEGHGLQGHLDVGVPLSSWLDLWNNDLGGEDTLFVGLGPGTLRVSTPSSAGAAASDDTEPAAEVQVRLPRVHLVLNELEVVTPVATLRHVSGQLRPSLALPVTLDGYVQSLERGAEVGAAVTVTGDEIRLKPWSSKAVTVAAPGVGPVTLGADEIVAAYRARRVSVLGVRAASPAASLSAGRVEVALEGDALHVAATGASLDLGSGRLPVSAGRVELLVPLGSGATRLVVPRFDATVEWDALLPLLRAQLGGGPAGPAASPDAPAPVALPRLPMAVEVRDGHLEVSGAGLTLNDLRVDAGRDHVDVSGVLTSAERPEGTVVASWRPAGDVPASVRLDYQGCLPPAPWRTLLAEGGLSISPGCRDSVGVQAWLGADEITFQGKVGVASWTVQEAHLAALSMADVAFDAELAGRVARDLSSAEVRLTSFASGPLRLSGSLSATRLRDKPVFEARLDVPEQACDNVVRALPAGLLPELDGLWLGGTFRLAVHYTVDLAKVFAMYDARLAGREEPYASPLEVDGENLCEVTKPPRGIDPQALNRADFVHHVVLDDDRELEVGPGTPSFVPLADLPPTVVQGALATEDLAFYSHPGVNPGPLKTALEMDLHAGRFKYGGSTITQQLVKNLYLTRSKTLARKLEDILLALYVETVVSKDRVLELYLNVIEFGDGVYGIRNASRVYFGKEPRELLPEEAAFLMTCKPAPPDCQRLLDRGSVTPQWRGKVDYVLERLYKRVKVIDHKEYEDARGREIRFLRGAVAPARPAGDAAAGGDGADDLLP